MTTDEAMRFLKRAFVVLPGVWEFIRLNSPNHAGTINEWSRTLEQISEEEAEAVLDRWRSGSAKPPSGFDRECFPMRVLELVKDERRKKYEATNREKIFNETKPLRLSDKVPGLTEYMNEIYKRINCFWNHQISEQELNEQLQQLEKQALDNIR